ncbi:sigma-70 family RNA polymerase sigma factor [Nocardioides sp. R1-1]|uniref:sigma-70 family RNA polymerase sigma factor n=1 Tax=Nocardioides sp. R1-1 TaxID=3383502 RepID=UPI0038D01FCA
MTAPMVDPLQDGDPVLLSRVRAGDPDAYAQLFARHHQAALGFARRLAGPSHADDLVAEAFARVLDTLQRDLGPTVSFRSYLLTAIRSIWNNTVRAERRYDLVDDFELLAPVDALTAVEDADQRFDNRTVAAAYRSLPERWQAVLWYTAVEGLPHGEVALHLGIKPNAVAALSFRAREGLRQAYLAEHLATVADAECRRWVSMLPSYARGSLTQGRRAELDRHLDGCLSCTAALADLDDVNNRLGALLVPVVLGAGAVGLPGVWSGLDAAASAAGGGTTIATGKVGLAAAALAALVGAVVLTPLLVGDAAERPSGADGATMGAVGRVPGPVRGPRTPSDAFVGPAVPADRPAPTGRLGRPGTATGSTTQEHAELPAPTRGGRSGLDADLAGPALAQAAPVAPPPPAAEVAPPGLSPDAALGQAEASQVSLLNVSLSRVVIPVLNLRPGAVVAVEITNLRGHPLRLDREWRCPGTVDDAPTEGDVTATTTVACTWTGAETAAGLLRLGIITSGVSEVTATLVQAPGVVDPDPSNNTTSLTITP